MPANIQLPSDFERRPEFRQLVAALRQRHRQGPHASIPFPIEAIATHLWMRLFVELVYQAHITNRPGWLADGRALYEDSVGSLFGDDCPPLPLLVESRLLEERDGDYFCAVFAEFNEQAAGNYVKREKRGQLRSEFVRQERELTMNALANAQLLPPEKFRKADGSEMEATEVQKAMMVVTRIDRALALPNRNPGGFTQGLIADAGRVGMAYQFETIKEVCFWLLEARRHPATPKTTEQILAGWENVLVMAGVKRGNGELI